MVLPTKNKRRNYTMEALLPFLGLLEPYKISFIPVTAIVLIVAILLRNEQKIRISKAARPFIIFVSYMVVRDVFHMFFSVSDPVITQIKRVIENVSLYVLIIVGCNEDFDEDVLYKWWKIAGTIFGVGMIYHLFSIYVMGQNVQPISIIPGYEISHDINRYYDRPTSFFSEPAAYVVSMLPLLFLSLKRKKLVWAVGSTILIIASTSSVGIILTSALWLVFFMFEKRSIKTTILYTLSVVALLVMILKLPMFAQGVDKMEDVANGESTWKSRVEGPYLVIKAMEWKEYPLGANIQNTLRFVQSNISSFPKDSSPYKYFMMNKTIFLNTFSLMIFRYGIVGLVLYLRLYKNKLFDKRYGARMYAIVLLIASVGQGAIASPGIPFALLLMYANKANSDCTDIEK